MSLKSFCTHIFRKISVIKAERKICIMHGHVFPTMPSVRQQVTTVSSDMHGDPTVNRDY